MPAGDAPPAGSPQPRGGWLTVAAAFTALTTCFGVVYTFGNFLAPLAETFHLGTGPVSSVFAGTTFLFFMLGAVTGPLADRLGTRPLVAAGAVSMAAGLVLTSLAASAWVVIPAYAIGVGTATGCAYVPVVAAVGRRFRPERVGAAMAFVSTGIGAGTLAFPPLAAALIGWVGWRAAYQVLAAGSFVLLLACAALIGPRVPAPAETAVSSGRLMRSRRYWLLYVTMFLLDQALYVGLVDLVPFARSVGVPAVSAALLVSAVGVGSVAGRLVLAPLGVWVRPLALFKASVVVFGLSYAVWLLSSRYPSLVSFAVLLGVGYGGWVAIAPALVAQLFGTRDLGRSIGILWTAAGLAALSGLIAAGFLIDAVGFRVTIAAALVNAGLAIVLALALRAGRRPLAAAP
ncbi:MAG: MFS transporter [bacterium]|jgi:MFS family permease|nr:MFS transporter [bacterium]